MAKKRWILALVALVIVLASLVIFVRENDAAFALYKRLKAKDKYVYEEVRPNLVVQDPRTFLTIETPEDFKAHRATLSQLVYGADGQRQAEVPLLADQDSETLAAVRQFSGAAEAHRYGLEVRPGQSSYIYLIIPEEPLSGRGLIYHHGFAGSFPEHPELIEAALEKHLTVIAMDQLGYGENPREVPCDFSTDPSCIASLQFEMMAIKNPLAMHVEPVRVALDLMEQRGINDVTVVGFSAGSGTIVLTAALEPRIKSAIAVAGTLPYYLREGQDAPIGVADYPPLREAMSLMDLYILGASGEGRVQTHLFNRYDRCCFRNVKGLLYEPALSERIKQLGLGGRFQVRIDESHAHHGISKWGIKTIFNLMGLED
ncbi:MAG: alpha/beta fold hydrolase [Alphaproteobacteria bacterium]|nr:alpha/beta fold hydrolase [Alphaproteobacteria bacterium]